jgi:uncharacterized protein Yka (UPF0111/DUF47 family)
MADVTPVASSPLDAVMTTKTQIVEQLGEAAVLLPDKIATALAANDRAKLRLTLLQDAVAKAADPGRPVADLSAELRATGLDNPAFASTVAGARSAGGGQAEIPGAEPLIQGLYDDLRAMIAPVSAADPAAAGPLAKRLEALAGAAPKGPGPLSAETVGRMTAARAGNRDSEHVLIMDLHKAINRIAGETAAETVDGARAHHLGADDRRRLQAFMRGLNRTAPLAFGHPGLGTTAVGDGRRLTIQNDIGATEAHVIVIHVEGLQASVTYTDVHRGRAKFFMGLFDGQPVEWTPLSERPAAGLGEDSVFYLVTGRLTAKNEGGLDGFLESLGSRLVFLIDWNKARKALQTFVGKAEAIDLLGDAAVRDLGHRAFLELGGAELVLEAVRRVAGARATYGARLDSVLGEDQARRFLGHVLRLTSEGLSAGRSVRLLKDEIEADLADCLQGAEGDFIRHALRHLGLSRMLAGDIRDALVAGRLASEADRNALAARATRLEQKGDRLTLEARTLARRIGEAGRLRQVIDQAEEALDALDEAAFLFSLLADPLDEAQTQALAALAEVTVDSAGQMVTACEAASRTPSDRRQDRIEALQAIDAVCAAERAADVAERRLVALLLRTPSPDARGAVAGVELAHTVERSTDHMAHAALALRDHLLGEIAA